MMVQKRQNQRRSHNASHKVCANWSGLMPGSDKSASGTRGTCLHSRTGTATRVTSQDNMDLTTINQKQYTTALVINNKISKLQCKKPQRKRPPSWQQRLQRQIDQLSGEISIIAEYMKGNSSNKTRRKLKEILKKYKVTTEDQLIACKEDLKHTLQSKAQRLQREVSNTNRTRG